MLQIRNAPVLAGLGLRLALAFLNAVSRNGEHAGEHLTLHSMGFWRL